MPGCFIAYYALIWMAPERETPPAIEGEGTEKAASVAGLVSSRLLGHYRFGLQPVQKALPLFNVFVDFTNRFVWY